MKLQPLSPPGHRNGSPEDGALMPAADRGGRYGLQFSQGGEAGGSVAPKREGAASGDCRERPSWKS